MNSLGYRFLVSQHKVFAGLAHRGKSSTDWFFDFKLHVVFNDLGEVLDLTLTPGNMHDLKSVPRLVKRLFGKRFGKRFGDKGYLSQPLFKLWFEAFNVQLINPNSR